MAGGYFVRKFSEVTPIPCLCGASTRLITVKDTPLFNLHVTHIMDSEKHYHRECAEAYYILEGSGVLELGEDEVALEPGVAVYIEPGTPHRGRGDFRAVIVGVPAQRPEDEHIIPREKSA
jgi:mannose-6-phosphate isomerase-like protein (cupin superfamily)